MPIMILGVDGVIQSFYFPLFRRWLQIRSERTVQLLRRPPLFIPVVVGVVSFWCCVVLWHRWLSACDSLTPLLLCFFT